MDRDGGTEAQSRVGTRLNDEWTIDAVLGVGGMATVFAATGQDGERAALKVLHAELSRDRAARESFVRESRTAESIDHPARVAIRAYGVSDRGEAFLVMELLQGDTLAAVLERRGRLPLEDVLRIFDPVLDLLAHCHERGIVHRDIKPGNVFLTSSGGVKVLDFGIARLRDDAGLEAARSGQVIGTPSFMAPEQALGLGEIVDGRADLWAVGACIFTALSGRRLHEARTENEAMLLAASKAAPSLATVMPPDGKELPVEVVAFVDRALAYDRGHRFADAQTMRRELVALHAASAAGVLSTEAPKKQTGVVTRASDVVDEEQLDEQELDKALSWLRQFWKHMANYMSSVRQYGFVHSASQRALKAVSQALADALVEQPDAIRWDVSSGEFELQGSPVWQPDRAPFDRIPFQLFADGVRKVQVKPGITDDELRDFAAILLRDPGDVGADDDAVTALWDRRFDHVAYVAVDSFALGDDSEEGGNVQAARDAAIKDVLRLSRIDKDTQDDSLEARAMQKNLAVAMREAAVSASSLALDAPTRTTLAALVSRAMEEAQERHVEAVLDGFAESHEAGDVAVVTDALAEWSSDQVKLRQYAPPTAMIDALEAGLEPRLGGEQAHEVARHLWRTMLPSDVVRRALAQTLDDLPPTDGKGPAPRIEPAVVQSLRKMLVHVDDDALFDPALEAYERPAAESLRDVLYDYIARCARLHVEEIGELLERAEADVASRLVDLLDSIGTPKAGSALARGTRNPAATVRYEAMRKAVAMTPGVMATPLDALLDDPDALVRTEALRLVAEHQVRDVGPALVRRIVDGTFFHRPPEEQRALLGTLDRLNPGRAEAIMIEMLGAARIAPSPALERGRALAAELLGHKSSEEARSALKKVAREFWRNTAPVREAAKAALARMDARSR